MSTRNLIIAVVVVLLLGGVGWFLMQNNSKMQLADNQISPTPVASSSATPTSTDSAATSSGNVVEVSVESKGLSLSPNEIKVKKGDTVKLTFKNTQGTHDLNLDEFNVKTKMIKAGAQETVEFVADKVGSFEYYCSVLGHRAAGMKGTLVVE